MPTSKVSLAVKAAGTVRLTVVRATSLPSTVSTTSAGAPGLAIVVSTSIRCLPGGELVLRARDVALDDHHVVLVDELALVHVEREPAGGAAERVEHARGVLAELGVDRHVVALAAEARRGELRHAGRRRVEVPARVGRLDAVLGMDAQPDAGADREDLVRLRLLRGTAPSSASSRLGSFAARSSACEKSVVRS